MKNTINEIIQSFSRQEFREFKYFVGKGIAGHHREELKLLEQIRKGEDTAMKNINAHHQTRKRLKKQLEQFAVLENLRHDEFSRLHALMETAKYLFKKNLHQLAWQYLVKAEQIAAQSEEYSILDYNYQMQIVHAYNMATIHPEGFSVPALLEKWENNKVLAHTDSNADAAYALLIHELRDQFSRQLTTDIDVLSDSILKRYDLDSNIYDNKLRIYCKIVNLVCRALREKREYSHLKDYAMNSYKIIEQKKALDKVSPDFLMDLLDMICVGTLRSKDYVNCEKYTRLYELHAKDMLAHPDEHSYYDFIPHVGVCDISLCTNKPEEARRTMIAAKKKYADYTQSARIYFLLRVNLLAVHFSFGEYDACIRLYNEIKKISDRKILSEPGFRVELILYTEIYSILFHYEDGDAEYALYLLQKLKRKHATLLKRSDSRREKLFIKILENLLDKTNYIKSNKFASDAEQFINMKEFIAGDFEYISMNAWLNSKLTGKKYYSCFLDLVRI